jgi:hypothetical protein
MDAPIRLADGPDGIVARRTLGAAHSVAHCLLEAYSVLTRLPPPHRVPGQLAADFLDRVLTAEPLALSPAAAQGLPARLAGWGITGGASYDALIAATAMEYGAELLSLDVRAVATSRVVGVRHRLLA